MALGEITVHQCKSTLYLAVFSFVACFQMIMSAGLIYGYASLLVVFKDLKLYQSECNGGSELFNSTGTLTFGNSTGGEVNEDGNLFCPARDKSLNLPFAIAVIIQCLVKIPLGNLVDTFGAKSSQYLGCCTLMLFGLCLGYVDEGQEYLLFISFIFVSIASSLLMLCPMQVTNIIFMKNKALFISLLSGCVDGSAVVFIIFLEIYQTGIAFSQICISYSVGVSVLLMIATTLLYPTKHVLQSFVELEIINNIRSSLNDDQDDLDEATESSFSLMRSQDFVTSYMSSYNMYHEAIQKSLTQIKDNERREALLSSLSENMAIQMSQQNEDYRMHYIPEKPCGTIVEGSMGYQDDTHQTSQMLILDNSKGCEEKSLLISKGKSTEMLTPFSGGKFKEYYLSTLNILGTYTSCVATLKLIYFVANLDKYLLQMADSATATKYIKYFGYVQFSAMIAAPLTGLLFRENSLAERLPAKEDFVNKVRLLILPGFVFISILILMDGLQMVGNIHLSIPIFVLYLFGNSLVWCFMSLYYAFLFPAKYYCTLIGLCYGLCGVVSFVQYPLLALEQDAFKGNQNYNHWIFMVLLITTLIFPLYLIYFYKKLKSNMSHEPEAQKV